MLEKMKAVSNPLTIIALFAALAEVAGTVSLKFLTPELQATFIWFVMGFPVLLVGLFFFVLIKNPKVLYGPGDYREDATYLSVLSSEKQSLSLDAIQKSLDDAVTKINEEAKKVETTGATAKDQLVEIVKQRLMPVQAVVEEAREEVREDKVRFRNRSYLPAKVRIQVLDEAGYRCEVCCVPTRPELMYFLPLSKSKDYSPENLICLCSNCQSLAYDENWSEAYLRSCKENPCNQNPNIRVPQTKTSRVVEK